MKVRDIMKRGPVWIGRNDTLGVAQAAMARHHIRHLPVVSEGRVVGMLSERDVLAARARDDVPWWGVAVADAMHAPAQTVRPDDSLTEAAGRMGAARIGALPVVELGALLGIVTVSDVLEAEVRAAMGWGAEPPRIAADAMTPWPFTVRPEARLDEAIALIADRRIRHLPVVDATSTIVGMLSERDLQATLGPPARYLAERDRAPTPQRVRDVMSQPAVVVPFDRSLAELAHQFAEQRLSATPVIDKFGALIGIVSYVDLLRALAP